MNTYIRRIILLGYWVLGLTFSVAQVENILLDEEIKRYSPCEPSIAINFANPQNIVAGAILDKVYVSQDGGKTWTKSSLASPYGVFGDPCIVSDYKGNIYYLHLSDPGGNGWADSRILDRIVCQVSKDQGQSWSQGGYMGLSHPKDQDKEWAVADPNSKRLYAAWTEFDRYNSADSTDFTYILLSISKNRGKTWSEPVRLNQFPGDCLDGDMTVEGAVPAVGPEGQVYVAWAFNEQIYIDRSLDKGKTWLTEDILVSDQPGGWTFDIPGVNRCNGLPVTVCDLSDGPHRGTVYVNWADQRNGKHDTDIWLAKSTDQGQSWSNPIRVNDDAAGNHQFLTWLTVDPATGYLYCVFYDRRDHEGTGTDVYLAFSTDGGDTFTNLKISEKPFFPTPLTFFGDYNHIAAYQNQIWPIWTRMEEGRTSVWTANLSLAQLRNMAAEAP